MRRPFILPNDISQFQLLEFEYLYFGYSKISRAISLKILAKR